MPPEFNAEVPGQPQIPPAPASVQPTGSPTTGKPPWEQGNNIGKYSIDDLETVVQPLIEGFKLEMEAKLDSISRDLKKLSETEKKIESLVKDLEKMKGELSVIAEKKAEIGNYDEELSQLKGSVNTILEILKGTLPPVIKSLRELKGDQPDTKKKKKEVEHLI